MVETDGSAWVVSFVEGAAVAGTCDGSGCRSRRAEETSVDRVAVGRVVVGLDGADVLVRALVGECGGAEPDAALGVGQGPGERDVVLAAEWDAFWASQGAACVGELVGAVVLGGGQL